MSAVQGAKSCFKLVGKEDELNMDDYQQCEGAVKTKKKAGDWFSPPRQG